MTFHQALKAKSVFLQKLHSLFVWFLSDLATYLQCPTLFTKHTWLRKCTAECCSVSFWLWWLTCLSSVSLMFAFLCSFLVYLLLSSLSIDRVRQLCETGSSSASLLEVISMSYPAFSHLEWQLCNDGPHICGIAHLFHVINIFHGVATAYQEQRKSTFPSSALNSDHLNALSVKAVAVFSSLLYSSWSSLLRVFQLGGWEAIGLHAITIFRWSSSLMHAVDADDSFDTLSIGGHHIVTLCCLNPCFNLN